MPNDSGGSRTQPSRQWISAETQSLIVIDRRALIGGSLSHWFRSITPEFDPTLAPTISAVGNDILHRASAIIFVTGAMIPVQDEWLCDEVMAARTRRESVPFVLFADTAETSLVDEAARQFLLSGYIPTSSSLELAATALQLILAGGRYFPKGRHEREAAEIAQRPQMPSAPAPCTGLTPRELAVLELLERGVCNKIIAYKLGMSLSTVKAHVHNIIVKLRVRNRTEAAVFRHVAAGR